MKENSKKAVQLLIATIPKIAQQDWQDTLKQNEVIWLVVNKCFYLIVFL